MSEKVFLTVLKNNKEIKLFSGTVDEIQDMFFKFKKCFIKEKFIIKDKNGKIILE